MSLASFSAGGSTSRRLSKHARKLSSESLPEETDELQALWDGDEEARRTGVDPSIRDDDRATSFGTSCRDSARPSSVARHSFRVSFVGGAGGAPARTCSIADDGRSVVRTSVTRGSVGGDVRGSMCSDVRMSVASRPDFDSEHSGEEGDEEGVEGMVPGEGRNITVDVKEAVGLSLGLRQAVLRRVCGTIAHSLGRVFGLQFTHGHAAPNGGAPLNILSSVGNQVEHVVALLCSRMDEFATDTFLGALRKSVAAMHEKVFANFINWVKHVGLPARVRTSSVADFHEHKMHLPPGFVSLGSFDINIWEFQNAEEGNKWMCNAQLQRLLLFFLLHGEAANLRHLPECLCFLFYGMSHCLLLEDTCNNLDPSGVDFPDVVLFAFSDANKKNYPSFPSAAAGRPPSPGDEVPGQYPPLDFLHSVVSPIWGFIKNEVLDRKDEDVSKRAMHVT